VESDLNHTADHVLSEYVNVCVACDIAEENTNTPSSNVRWKYLDLNNAKLSGGRLKEKQVK
jgi:hypothetical protein